MRAGINKHLQYATLVDYTGRPINIDPTSKEALYAHKSVIYRRLMALQEW